MAHIIKDFFMGSILLAAGIVLSFAAFIVLFVLWIFLNILGALVWVFLIVFLFFAAIWLIGYIFRKIRE